jgi:hypothetical protein
VVFVSWGDAWRTAASPAPGAVARVEKRRAVAGLSPGARLRCPVTNILGTGHHDEKNKAPKQIPTWPTADPRYAAVAALGVLGMAGNVSNGPHLESRRVT